MDRGVRSSSTPPQKYLCTIATTPPLEIQTQSCSETFVQPRQTRGRVALIRPQGCASSDQQNAYGNEYCSGLEIANIFPSYPTSAFCHDSLLHATFSATRHPLYIY